MLLKRHIQSYVLPRRSIPHHHPFLLLRQLHSQPLASFSNMVALPTAQRREKFTIPHALHRIHVDDVVVGTGLGPPALASLNRGVILKTLTWGRRIQPTLPLPVSNRLAIPTHKDGSSSSSLSSSPSSSSSSPQRPAPYIFIPQSPDTPCHSTAAFRHLQPDSAGSSLQPFFPSSRTTCAITGPNLPCWAVQCRSLWNSWSASPPTFAGLQCARLSPNTVTCYKRAVDYFLQWTISNQLDCETSQPSTHTIQQYICFLALPPRPSALRIFLAACAFLQSALHWQTIITPSCWKAAAGVPQCPYHFWVCLPSPHL